MSFRYDLVVFDLDGTLVDSYAALADAINYARAAHGLGNLDDDVIRGAVGDGIEVLLERTFPGDAVPDSAQRLFEERYDEVCCEQSRLLEDVEEVLAELTRSGVRMAVCTNKPTSFSRKILESLGIASHFAAIVGPDLAEARKPDARHLHRTISAARSEGLSALFVGDMPIDIAAARNSGIDVAVVPTGSSSAEALRAAEPDYFLESFREVPHIVRNGRHAHG